MPRTRAKKASEEQERKMENGDAGHAPANKTKEESSSESTNMLKHAAADVDQEQGEPKAQSSIIDDEASKETSETASAKPTMEERAQKMRDLRKKMADSSMANRRAVASEASQHKRNVRLSAGAQRKLDKAEKVLDERDARERGEDWDRVKAWNYTIEDNDRWEEKSAAKEQTKDQGPQDINSASERQYRRLVSQMKPGSKGIQGQSIDSKPSGSSLASSSSAVMLRSGPGAGQRQVVRKDDLYPDPSNLSYGTHKPDEAALDRVSAHLNAEADRRTKFSRKRADDGDGDVNYINDANKHYNKKIARYFDRYTQEIRDNFERGTAL